ncbi:DNA starvation/stationary phase protection protein Dps [Parasphingorhabdus sp. JC815]|uniref:DNA starvation/stationary phase protection protein Dps n=1 Tax=Parasphingorhabdus sp. JC815 TaxID=3232140 RepID=UPI003458858A
MPEKYVSKLDDNTIEQMIDLLNARLAGAIDLVLAVKQAHWNTTGKNFIAFHELLDEVADRLREISDDIAERAVILGGVAKGTLQNVKSGTALDAYPDGILKTGDHIRELKERLMAYGGELREAINTASEAGDEVTADLFTSACGIIDKDAWFIGANAVDD